MALVVQKVTISQCRDAGLALVLISLILAYASSPRYLLPAAIVLLVLTMTAPAVFSPFAKVWFGLSHALGTVVSKIILSFVFYLLVTPVGLLRRALGKDPMQLKSWKKGSASVFHERNCTFEPKDLEHPY